jgi:hypothetical protein
MTLFTLETYLARAFLRVVAFFALVWLALLEWCLICVGETSERESKGNKA